MSIDNNIVSSESFEEKLRRFKEIEDPINFFEVVDLLFKEKGLYSVNRYKRKLLNNNIYLFLQSEDCKNNYPSLYNYYEACGDFKVFRVSFYHKTFDIFCPFCGKTRVKGNIIRKTCGSRECNSKQHKKTFLEIYGVENPSQAESIKKKKAETSLKNYGVEHPLQSKLLLDRMHENNLKKWGTKYPAQLEEVKQKTKESYIAKYGTDNPHKDPLIKAKIRKTCEERYGGPGPQCSESVREKSKQTLMKNYGVDNPSKSEEIQKRKIETNREKFGADWNLQSEELRKDWASSYRYDSRNFDSSWELAFYVYLKDNNIDFKFHEEKYLYEDTSGKPHYYFPDFKIGDKIIEIKGSHLIDDQDNLISPYEDSPENIEDILRCKKDLMKSLGVIILKKPDIEYYIKYIKKTRGNNFFKECTNK